jgi:hypothetical protein
MAISSMVRRSSILQIRPHSCGVRETEVVVAWLVKTGTRRVEGMRFERTCHSSMRRAASMRRFVLDFWMVVTSVSCPGVKTKSPSGQIASSYIASSPWRSPTWAWTIWPPRR